MAVKSGWTRTPESMYVHPEHGAMHYPAYRHLTRHDTSAPVDECQHVSCMKSAQRAIIAEIEIAIDQECLMRRRAMVAVAALAAMLASDHESLRSEEVTTLNAALAISLRYAQL